MLLMLIFLIMGSLYSVVSQLSKVSSDASRAAGTQNALKQAKEALIAYAITYRDTHSSDVFGYLPCPDVDGDGSADGLDSQCGSSDKIVVGLLPYRTLGLADIRDANGQCLWYAVSGTYKRNSTKYTPLNWDTRGQIKVLDQDGTTVLLDPTTDSDGGAAAIIFTAGPPLTTQTGRTSASSTSCGISSKTLWASYLESASFDGNGYSTDSPLAITRGDLDSSSNNDLIVWITPKEIWDRFRKRSDRGSINSLTAAIKTVLENGIISDLTSTQTPTSQLPQNATTYTTVYSGRVGELPAISGSLDSSLTSYFTNWQEQYRYVVCNNLCGYCLNVGGQQCDGALFFGGADTSGNPRAAGARSVTNLFEDGDVSTNARPLLLATSNTFDSSGNATTYAGGSADVGVCLASKTNTLETALAHCTLSDAAATSSFTGTAGSGSVAIDSVNHTITLGASGGSATGCVWTANTYAFGTGLRVYFKVNMTAYNASGITFAIIDSDRQTSTTPCGDQGGLLGYSSSSSFYSSTSVKPPKIGLEFDTANSYPSYGDPQTGADKHAALIYWGAGSNATFGNPASDDNTHGATASSGFHSNPSTASSGFSGNLSSLFAAGLFHVRMDITRSYTGSPPGTYIIKVWLLSDASATATQRTDLKDITHAFTATSSGGLSPTLSDGSFMLNNYVTGAEALKNIRLGFTTGQISGSGSQSIVISDLLAYVLP